MSVSEPSRKTSPLSSMMARPSVSFLVLSGPEGEGSLFQVQRSKTALGRTQGDVLLESDRFVDPLHASLRWEAGAPVLEDQGSVNGTWKRILEPQVLVSGDEIRVGQQHFVVEDRPSPSVELDGGLHYFVSLAHGGRLRVRQLLGGGRFGAQLVHPEDDFTLGSDHPAFASDPHLSLMHARIWRESDGRVLIQDLGSLNGTWVRLTGPTPLRHGDQVLVGESAMCVVISA